VPKADVPEQVALLSAAFPRENIPPETLSIYVSKLGDIESDLLAATVNRIIEESRFFPTISELRRMAAHLAGLMPPEPAEALAMIRSCEIKRQVYRRDGSYAYTEHEWDWSRLSDSERDFCQEVLFKVGDPQDFEAGERRFGWDNGFQKVSEQMAVEVTAKALANLSPARLLPGMRPIARITGGHGGPDA